MESPGRCSAVKGLPEKLRRLAQDLIKLLTNASFYALNDMICLFHINNKMLQQTKSL